MHCFYTSDFSTSCFVLPAIDGKIEQRVFTKFCVKRGKFASETFDMPREAFGEDGSVVYNCCWPSPEQSFSGPSPAGLMTIVYCLRFKISQTWRDKLPYLTISLRNRVAYLYHFRSLLRLAGLRLRHSNWPPYGLALVI
jgi:hypothetical protein